MHNELIGIGLIVSLVFAMLPEKGYGQDDDRFKGFNKRELQGEIIRIEQEFTEQLLDCEVQIQRRKSNIRELEQKISHNESLLTQRLTNEEKLRRSLELVNAEVAELNLISDSLANKIKRLTEELEAKEISNFGHRGPLGDVFDFEIDLGEGKGWGVNPVNMMPIGWSQDGKFCYVEEYCDGGCGCCGMSIIVYDTESSKNIVSSYVSLEEYQYSESTAQVNQIQSMIANQVIGVCDRFQIIPNGMGFYQQNRNNGSFGYNTVEGRSRQFELEVKKNQDWDVIIRGEGGTKSVIASFEIEIDDNYGGISPHQVIVAGVISNPFGHQAIVPCLTATWGYELEEDWSLNMLTLPHLD